MIITIDGPTASGKSSVARNLAEKLGIMYINSGLLFRGIAYVMKTEPPASLEHILLANQESALSYQYSQKDGAQMVYRGTTITPYLKTPEVDRLASEIGLNLQVREIIQRYQQDLALRQSVIAEGRDCGTVIFPHADYKFYITAPLEVRAQRWQHEQEKKGLSYSLEESKRLIEERDTRDSERALAPLTVPHDAFVIDSNFLTIDQVVTLCLEHIDCSG